MKGYLKDESNDKIPLSNIENLDITTFSLMINNYIKDNVGIYSDIDSIENGTLILEKLFPDMKLNPKGMSHF